MKEASWNDCIESYSAKKVSPNLERSRSLMIVSGERIKIIKEINLLELLQALVIKNGYNVLNHLCIGYYIRDVLRRDDLYSVFDDVRYKRNSLTYYGNRMDFETAMQAIKKCKKLIKEFKNILKS